MNSPIAEAIRAARAQGGCAFIPYLTGGFPDMGLCRELLMSFDKAGAQVIEVGIPFSDPLADGPVIQAASHQALTSGTTPLSVLQMIAQVSAKVAARLVVMTYYNPVQAMGLGAFAERAADAGVAGVLIPDLPPEEAAPWLEAARKKNLDTIFMAAPTTPEARLPIILEPCRGFLYYVSMTGVTGSGLELGGELTGNLDRLRARTTLPVAVGFGVARPQQAKGLAPHADGVIVGSAFMKAVLEADSPALGVAKAAQLAGELGLALRA
jgi:tryptophan synthase alpha chain